LEAIRQRSLNIVLTAEVIENIQHQSGGKKTLKILKNNEEEFFGFLNDLE
jgi:hypothetical protein